ncbi:amino-acid N-acetyltransferase [Chitinivorax tropicus]|uniref:Amino-acid acetyltransferase n=1 Tax=Chitinivorax tropicus TaxID=714531 RepID=A0A840MHS6_9PROT|nr:amino-acid N-acetyltransferase [Chitinivorax tropicus]MBB5017075.1 amino-acid N-acetyltransferase [Chitinivorax tropicus]
MQNSDHLAEFVDWFRASAPYIHAFRGKTFVVAFGGEVVQDGSFYSLTHDLNLLVSLGVRLVLVHGTRPQIEAEMAEKGLTPEYHDGIRITDGDALECAKQSVGQVRVEIEAALSMGLPNSPMAGADIRVASGNYVTAQPMGVRNGIDFNYTGKVRKINTMMINGSLDDGEIVLLSPLGYSPTGEVFNLTLENVATEAAVALRADKLVFLTGSVGVVNRHGELLSELSAQKAQKILDVATDLTEDIRLYLPGAIRAARNGVPRAHLINRRVDGGLIMELFTREGIGTMVTAEPLEQIRQATIDDVGGILALIEPLEEEGVLVKRSRELLEMEINQFTVLKRYDMVIGCVALYPYLENNMAELACLAVEPEFRDRGLGDKLLQELERRARNLGDIRRLFVLTTRTAHWFIERGFKPASVDDLPLEKQRFYNYQRRSKVFIKTL